MYLGWSASLDRVNRRGFSEEMTFGPRSKRWKEPIRRKRIPLRGGRRGKLRGEHGWLVWRRERGCGSMEREAEWVRGEVSSGKGAGIKWCRPSWAMVRSLDFILSLMESRWKVLSRGVMQSDLHFWKPTEAAARRTDGWEAKVEAGKQVEAVVQARDRSDGTSVREIKRGCHWGWEAGIGGLLGLLRQEKEEAGEWVVISHVVDSRGCWNKAPWTTWLKTTEIYCLTAQEARSLKSKHWQGRAPSKTCREETFLASSTFWVLPAVLGVPWLVDVFTPLSTSVIMWPLPPCLCLFLQGHQSYWSRTHSITHSNDLILTWLHLQRPYFQTRARSKALGVRTST